MISALLGLYFAPYASGSLSSQINGIIAEKNSKGAVFGVKIINADTGKVLYSRNPKKPMIPASNMKLITTGAAVHYLGWDYKFTTQVGLLEGNLVVIGGGDPLLGDPDTDMKHERSAGWLFEDIITALRQQNISSVNNIYIDSTIFDDNRVNPNWPASDLNLPYAAEVSGINFSQNSVLLHVKREASRASVTVLPKTSYLKIINNVKLVSRGSSSVGSNRLETPNHITVFGNCRKEIGFEIAIERPAAFFGYMLYERLSAAGIKVTGDLVEKYVKNDPGIRILRTYETPIREVLLRCNKDSFNLAAECFVKTISAEKTKGKINGDWPHAFSLIGNYLKSIGIRQEEFVLDDGSGLSRENRLTPNAIVMVLQHLYNSENWESYRQTLAVGGVDGTMSTNTYRQFRDDKYKGRVNGKTGYINGARTLSGVAHTEKGTYLFSVMSEGGTSAVRSAVNRIAIAILDNM